MKDCENAAAIQCHVALSETAAQSMERARFACPDTLEIELAPEGWQVVSDHDGTNSNTESSA
jgi:hypothetical protein